VYGERVIIAASRQKKSGLDEILTASKIIFVENIRKQGTLRLARGKVKFTDYTKTGQIRALASGLMSQLTRETGSYLKHWDEYGEIEGDILLKKAKSVGRIDFTDFEVTHKGIKFFTTSKISNLSVDDTLELINIEPPYIRNPQMNWTEYNHALEEEFSRNKKKNNEVTKNNETIQAKILSIEKNSLELKMNEKPSKGMFLVLSISGDKTQIERRMNARTAIVEGKSANPLLGLIIEEGGRIPHPKRVKKIKPLSSFVEQKIFRHQPTERQVEAIDIALNTPDIALIQGPPGTGKTTVITAILERLNEEHDKTTSVRGQILVTGFQHDAVNNIVSRLSVNALPSVKFGRRSSDSEFAEDVVSNRIHYWSTKVAERIRKNNPQLNKTEEQLRLDELFIVYALSPSKTNTLSLLKRISDIPEVLLSKELSNRVIFMINELLSNDKSDHSHIEHLVRSLRIREVSFEDDGSLTAMALLDEIENQLSPADQSILETASRWKPGKPLTFLTDLKDLKERLLYNVIPKPEFSIEKPRADVLQLIGEVSSLMKITMKTTDRKDAILADFLHELEDNPDGIREAIEDYNFVFAATTQQAEGSEIRHAKKKFGQDGIRYDTIIVDEAARTSPRDLLIPMSQAEKRIILVGDHRQLPHLIDEEIARALEQAGQANGEKNFDFYKKSMFEYLFRRLKNLEKQDGIKRTVTLDAQYRMHPILGNFVSDNFYRIHNEAYRSPLPCEYFEQNHSMISRKAAIWINLPHKEGKEESDNNSRRRDIEAEKIAEYLSQWINSEEGKKLNFGVISFYRAQVDAVYKALSDSGITEELKDNSWQITSDYSHLENGEERLRIGTVDSFQGMEFDVVFLSMVRSPEAELLSSEMDYAEKQKRIFGHLMSENRLCVSMSRQKKALILVGDGELINSKIAADAVPALKNYYNLCFETGVIL
jgi:superfamily I DNA and/or RNA helicase